VREGQSGHDSDGPRQLRVTFHGKLVAHDDKYLAPENKRLPGHRAYKTHLFNREPELARMELTIERRARTTNQAGMEKDPKTIAIIDDDNGMRQALKRMLTTAGFRAHIFASAEEFLAAMDNCPAGCAVVDLELGKMSGFDLACHPKLVAARLPIIFISGTADETARASALALGCVEYLRKPFMPIELLGAVLRATQESAETS
jgi:CheY-like chemotaxis protein